MQNIVNERKNSLAIVVSTPHSVTGLLVLFTIAVVGMGVALTPTFTSATTSVNKPDLTIEDSFVEGGLLKFKYCNRGTGMEYNAIGSPANFYIKATTNGVSFDGRTNAAYLFGVPNVGQCKITDGYEPSRYGLTTWPSSMTVIAEADWQNSIAESNESNNTLTKAVIVSTTPSSIIVLSPNGGEQWAIGSGQSVRWSWSESTSTNHTVRLISAATGQIIANLGLGVDTRLGASGYSFIVPQVTPGNYKVRVCDDYLSGASGVCDDSDAPFSIVANISSEWIKEQVKCVFNGSNTEQKCYTTLETQIGCSGVNSCIVDNVPGWRGETITWKSSCGGYAYTTIDGQNEYATFQCSSVQPSITVLSPNGGEALQRGEGYSITWTHPITLLTPLVFDISLVPYQAPCPAGQVCTLMIQAPYTIVKNYYNKESSNGVYPWVIGNVQEAYRIVNDGAYYIQVCQSGTSICDQSDSYFKIVTSPTTFKEQVKCVFNGSNTEQTCYTASGEKQIGCSGINACIIDVAGYKGEQITWKSSCGGDAYTTMDGVSEYADFNCSVTPSITLLSPNGGETWIKGTTQAIKWQDNTGTISCPVGTNCILPVRYYDLKLVSYYPPCTGQVCPAYPYLAPYTIATGISGSLTSYSWSVGKIMNTYGNGEIAPDGSYTVQVCVSGSSTCDSSDSYFKIVSAAGPVILGVSGPQSLAVGQTGTWSVKASDSSGSPLTYSVLWGDEIAVPLDASRQSVTPPQQTATFTHAYQGAGNYTPTFTVTNQSGANAQASLSVVVGGGVAINTPPKITSVSAPTNLQVGEYSQFGFAAVDPDRDDLSWAVNWGETGISSAVACPVSPLPGEGKGRGYTTKYAWNTPGTYRVSVYVTDCHGGEDSDAFTVVVGGSERRTIVWQNLAWTPIDVGATAPDDGTWYTYGDELRQDGVTDRHYKVVANSMTPQTDYEVKTIVRLRDGRQVGLCGRMDDAGNGYCYAIGDYNDTFLAVFQGNDQNPEVATVSKNLIFDQNAEYILKLRLTGPRVQGKAYRLGQPEPAEWAIDFEDSRFKSGKVGLYSYGSRPAFSYLALGAMSGQPIPPPEPTPSPVSSRRDESVEGIERRASLLYDDRLAAILSELQLLRNLVQEQQTEIKYLKSLTSDLAVRSSQAEAAIKNFITYGVDENTKKLGAGERAAVMHSYKSAFDKLPETEEELTDAIKIANGRWPSEESTTAEARAKTEFKKIYGRNPNLKNQNDDAAVTIMAYGLRQRAENRNLRSEAQGIITFKWLYNRIPSSTEDWNIVQAITYSGAKR